MGKNRDKFNYSVITILARLYDEFPRAIIFSESDIKDENCDFVSDAMEYLKELDAIEFEGMNGKFERVKLTTKGYAKLNLPSSSIFKAF